MNGGNEKARFDDEFSMLITKLLFQTLSLGSSNRKRNDYPLKREVNIDPAFDLLLDITDYNADIVSVGSGFGATEKRLENKYGQEIITIDPIDEIPDDMRTVKMPMYPTVSDYLEEKKAKEVSLILDWPYPNKATYGIEAIKDLDPEVILVRYASCGAAASESLQSFLGSCGCPYDGSHVENPLNGTYTVAYENQKVIGSGRGWDGKTIDVVVLVKKH